MTAFDDKVRDGANSSELTGLTFENDFKVKANNMP
jgi:hypothetical protein